MIEWFRNWFEDFKENPRENSIEAIGIVLAIIGIVIVEYYYIIDTREVLLGEVIIRIPLGIIVGALIGIVLYLIGYLIYMFGIIFIILAILGLIIYVAEFLWNIVLWRK
jgi:hypothetical protein